MRQTGRTTRIVHHVIEQLLNVGTCVATDHVVYEYEPTARMLDNFEEKVKREVEFRTLGLHGVNVKRIRVEGVPYVKFELVLK